MNLYSYILENKIEELQKKNDLFGKIGECILNEVKEETKEIEREIEKENLTKNNLIFKILKENKEIKEENEMLKEERKKRGMTRQELSNKTGINIRTLESYEQKRRNIKNANYKILSNICNQLGCTIEDLLKEE